MMQILKDGRDYREHKALYRHIGFFTLIGATFLLSMKVTDWVLWVLKTLNATQ